MRYHLAEFTVIAMLATTAVAQTAERPAVVGTSKTPQADQEKVTCRTFETTGSRLGQKRECRTGREWAAQNAAIRSEIERQQADHSRRR